MRYVGLLLFLICIPLLAGAFKSNPAARRWGWLAIGASPYIYGWGHLSVSIVSWAYWPGYVKGLIVALPDLLAIAFLFSTSRQAIRPAVMVAFAAYIFAVALSMTMSDLPFASFQYVWQLIRVFLVAVAVARISAGSDAPRHIVYGMCYGVIFQAYFSIVQHFGHGVVQASGTMGHQNLLGMITHFALFTALALILAGDRAVTLKIGVLAALIAIALTGSRGTVGFAGGGVVALILLSLLRRPTAKKMQVAGAGTAILLLMAPIAYATLETRFAKSSDDGTYDERAAFKRAARAMWSDHAFGVGANEYVIIANTKGYSSRAGVIWNSGSRSANVHNTYLLVAAETGWPGIITFILLFLVTVVTALRAAWSRPVTRDKELLLGVAMALMVVSLHILYEWIFVIEATQYLFAIMLGMTMGLGVFRPSKSTASPQRLAAIPTVHDRRRQTLGPASNRSLGGQ